jgi:hypothetical protein
MKTTVHALAVVAFLSGVAMASKPATVKSIATARPCKAGDVVVRAYLHASRHGAWITGDPGLNGAGIVFSFDKGEVPGLEKTRNYIFRPQDNMNNTFQALFTGTISCNAHGRPVLKVRSIEEIRISPIRDAN